MVHVERVRRRGRDRRSRAAGQRADQRVPARDHEDVAGAAAAVRHAGGARLSAGALAQVPDGLRQRKAAPRRGRRRLQTQG